MCALILQRDEGTMVQLGTVALVRLKTAQKTGALKEVILEISAQGLEITLPDRVTVKRDQAEVTLVCNKGFQGGSARISCALGDILIGAHSAHVESANRSARLFVEAPRAIEVLRREPDVAA